ncbi:bifunctional 2-C-methyl-D-erythritol 4-phosphate cytidylyltransferase/2-C-methyl-D-erythritol 2,4-cyclodiphosphate synthase [Terrihabitans rhizophilus]|uniref:Bifunctional enzyme IspD/IspF n=1 Tax=Terrihabitans rhizophilus TaxID=3092662 RepID=A0ABU4RMC5_9HYPH|nr:bifunctional 2-C-methyl-D-erythritol 4-phosphate cytidylyltransferase/2-C-methyl-D-erythritol 2,4-cyclodiphosphate synthase [Terrihabitans sp. PJ23]MDX6805363.1 bifunctional 2-C-methyl-D-erythritol 4-phosphate cytidylyltransferase/2-C-methyl-D-erythritol 2,4-cyclodiphosphate synthase [Terrihabitans sp. PJ23]
MSQSGSELKVAVLVVAAGRGTRAGGAGGPAKQYRHIAGRAVLTHTLEAFAAHPRVAQILTVIHADDRDLYDEAVGGFAKTLEPVIGGATRQDSVRNGLKALEDHRPDLVLIHDAARPFVSREVIDRSIQAATEHGAAVPVAAVVDTVCMVEAGQRGETLDRNRLGSVQTPQAFRFADILAAHLRAERDGRDDFTDDGAVASHQGLTIGVFPGDPMNTKLTTAEDFSRAEERLLFSLPDVRNGTGFDVHAFCPGDHVVLAGIKVPHDQGLLGHSDADVALHAITDAIFGALADGDIGSHFPPSDPQWKGADSAQFLAYAVDRVKARGGMLAHVDVCIMGEAPKVGPHRAAMQARIAEICGLTIDRVGVKATTTEQLGFVGRREGLAAIASATIRLPV